MADPDYNAALAVCEEFGRTEMGLEKIQGFMLEILMEMKAAAEGRGDHILTPEQLVAFRTAFSGFRKLFLGDDA